MSMRTYDCSKKIKKEGPKRTMKVNDGNCLSDCIINA